MILDQMPWSDPLAGLRGWGQKVKIQLFQNIVMLQVKLNGIKMHQHCSKYFAHSPPPPALDPRGQKVKIQHFQKMVMLHIKVKGMTNEATW